ncbi:unnamed protein product [Larinioides sclopetarius]|uniref:BTB domain-containing protein n=1 Tax=Larinioides sclopetarius TaxID=280406 RepID=A0AAV2BSE8_9ARAC
MDYISLNSNNHNSNLVNSLDHFKAVNSFVDVTLVCEGHTVKAHKIILSAGSNVLHRLLLANPAKHPIIILAETRYDTLRMIMDFLYKGKTDVPRTELRKLLAVAATFEINELKRLCEENLANQQTERERDSHPRSKSPPRKKRQSSDSDILCDAVFPKRESSSSPCTLEEPTVSEGAAFCPQIAGARSLNETPSTDSQDESEKKDASTECDIQPLKELENNLVPREAPRVKVKPRYIEKSDDSETDSQSKSSFLQRKRRAIVWKYYTVLNDNYAVCKICRNKLSYKTTISNLTKHIMKKHRQFDPKHPPRLPDLPLLTIQSQQLELFEEIDFNSVEEEAAGDQDGEQYEDALEEGIPSTSTPCILKIT